MTAEKSVPTADEVARYHTDLSNWGRWGEDDELGTLNLITPDARLRGVAAVQHGIPVSCAWDIPTGTTSVERDTYLQEFPPHVGGVSEHVRYNCHDQGITHLDSVSHIFWKNQIYNGRHVSDEMSVEDGVRFGGIAVAAEGLLTRGILIDIPGARGVEWLDFRDAVYPEDLDAALRRQNVTVEPGDAILLRTGYDEARRQTGIELTGETGQPGWHASCLPWLREHDVAYVGCDSGQDALPSGYPDDVLPVHTVALAAMGLWMIDNCDFSECARTAERLGKWDFLLSVAPIRFEATSGSAVNPIALF